jgi:hypothetical protein
MNAPLSKVCLAQELAEQVVALKGGALPDVTTRKCEDLLIDVVGLCVTARNEDYVASALNGSNDDGLCTAIGHTRTLTAAGAAFVNDTAAQRGFRRYLRGRSGSCGRGHRVGRARSLRAAPSRWADGADRDCGRR